jgi:hypothetical protein
MRIASYSHGETIPETIGSVHPSSHATPITPTNPPRPESSGLPPELTTFLYAKKPDGSLLRYIPSLCLSLGPYNTSFYVTDSSACLWMNLPPPLLSALQARIKNAAWIDRPRIVTLGAAQNFLLITEKHTAVWDLSHYATLSKMLEFSRMQKDGISEVYNATLHAYRYQCFLAQSRNGKLLFENLPLHELGALQSLQPFVLEDTRVAETSREERERRIVVERRPSLKQQARFRQSWGEGGKRQEIRALKQAKGLRLSLSLSVSAKGLAGGLGLGRILG